jgi:hypothetical protein
VVDILASSGNVTLTVFLVPPLIPICPYLSVYSLSLLALFSLQHLHNILQLSLPHLVLVWLFILCGRSAQLTFPLLQLGEGRNRSLYIFLSLPLHLHITRPGRQESSSRT